MINDDDDDDNDNDEDTDNSDLITQCCEQPVNIGQLDVGCWIVSNYPCAFSTK